VRTRTLVLLVECPVATTPAERVGLGVPLTVVRIVRLTIHFDFEAGTVPHGQRIGHTLRWTAQTEMKRKEDVPKGRST